MVRNENGFRAGYVFVDLATSDVGGWVERAKAQVATEVKLPPGYLLLWSGQWENLVRVRERLKVVIPITLALITLLLYANTRSGFKTALVLAIVPFSAIGAVALFWALGYNVSIAAWVGMIALAGLDAETAVFMLLFLDLSWKQARDDGQLRTLAQVDDTIVHGAVKRVRPKLMTVATAFFGLLPILFSTATGADVLKRVAAPMIGGLVTSFLAELLLYPPAYKLWKLRTEPPGSSIERLP
jgi:Cu(I)/Ag(I) efflux system membrane protein CusA/SilA